jgi:hypothetical protein
MFALEGTPQILKFALETELVWISIIDFVSMDTMVLFVKKNHQFTIEFSIHFIHAENILLLHIP